jgi:hypothetical protein
MSAVRIQIDINQYFDQNFSTFNSFLWKVQNFKIWIEWNSKNLVLNEISQKNFREDKFLKIDLKIIEQNY